MIEQVRSGRRASTDRAGRADPARRDVVVLGAGPIAAAVAVRLAGGMPEPAGSDAPGRSDAPGGAAGVGVGPELRGPGLRGAVRSGAVRTLPGLPASGAAELLAGAGAVVLVADGADLSAVRSGGLSGAGGRAADEDRRGQAVTLAQRTVSAARAAGVPRVVAVTSAMVHGAEPDRAVIRDDDRPPTTPVPGHVGDLIAVEAVLARAARRRSASTPSIMVLRPAAVVGPGVDTLVTRHFAAPRLLAVRGVERPWQLVHVDDVAGAVELALREGWSGSATVATEPVLSSADVLRLAGMRRVELPAVTAFGTAERLHRVGVLPVPGAELAYVVHPWTVDPARLRAAGWRPAYDAEECLRVLLEGVRGRVALAGRQAGRREVAFGAAGAAVALLGTAAVWRQARARRHG